MKISKVFKAPSELLEFASTAGESGESFSEKMKIFRTLISLRVKRLLNTNKTNAQKKFGPFSITAYDYYTLDFLYREVFLKKEYFFKTSNEAPVIIDCGANIGCSILFFKMLYPKAKIYAFEADPYVFTFLEKNVKENNLTDVFIYNVALSDKEEDISFYIGEDQGSMKGSINKDRGGIKELKVKGVKLSSFISSFPENIDMIKIDVEGAEINILADLCQANALNKADQMIVEYHHKMNGNRGDFAGFLQKFEESGFDYNLRSEYNQVRDFQDIVIHFYK